MRAGPPARYAFSAVGRWEPGRGRRGQGPGASVVVAGETIGAIEAGLLVLVCAERGDTEKEADALLAKLLGYRVFGDDAGKMNRSVRDVGGALLLVPQFTLAADTRSGTRPSF